MNSTLPSRLTQFLTAVCTLLLTATIVNAQLGATFTPPIIGYVFDSRSGKLRPLKGVPGSSIVGSPIEPGFSATQFLTLDENHFIASTDVSPELLLLNLESTPLTIAAIPDAPRNVSQAAGSIQGTSAACYYARQHQVLIVTGLPQTPVVSQHIDLSPFSEPITHMAVSNDGTLLVFAVNEGLREAVYGWTASSGKARLLSSAISTSSLAITGQGAAIVADRGANEVFAIWDAAGAALRQSLAGEREGVSNPAGVAISPSNRIYIGNAGSSTVTVLDSDGHYAGSHYCGCSITGVETLKDSVFRITDQISRTIFLLDVSFGNERILFVPPAKD